MGEFTHWWQHSKTRQQLEAWHSAAALSSKQLAAAQHKLELRPDAMLWRNFLSQLSLWLAAGLIGAGIISLVAANWEYLGKFARLLGLQGLLIIAVFAVWKLGLQNRAG